MFSRRRAAILVPHHFVEEDAVYAQSMWFDGPRSPELVAATSRAGRERIEPAIRAHPELMEQLVATIVMRRSDGAELVVTIAEAQETLRRSNEIVRNTGLLPDEDPALLRAADRFDEYEVVHTFLGKAVLR